MSFETLESPLDYADVGDTVLSVIIAKAAARNVIKDPPYRPRVIVALTLSYTWTLAASSGLIFSVNV